LAVNAADLYTLLQHVHGTFEQVAAVTEKENNEHLIPTRLLMARAHAAWLAAVRLGMSGQVVETYPLVRVIVENAWYALHLAKDPAPPSRAEVWLRRSEDDAAEKRCATEFSIRNVRTTHALLDTANEAALYEVYKWTIAFGGHPNERGVLSATAWTDTGATYAYAVSQLTDKPVLIAAALKAGIEAAIGALRTFRLVFPERFAIVGLDRDVERLVDEHNAVFGHRRRRDGAGTVAARVLQVHERAGGEDRPRHAVPPLQFSPTLQRPVRCHAGAPAQLRRARAVRGAVRTRGVADGAGRRYARETSRLRPPASPRDGRRP
jgi:hypothetical protein